LAKKDPVADLLRKIKDDKGIECAFFSPNDPGQSEDISRQPSGILSLDIALGGGYPFGRIIELFGAPAGGKTTITLHAIASALSRGHVAAFIDAEHALSLTYAETLGVDTSKLLISQPDYGEQALDAAIKVAEKMNPGDLIVIDSVAALTPKAEIEGRVEDNHVGLQARMMSQAMRALAAPLSASGAICMFVNQVRMKIGVTFGSPRTTPGGEALKFYSSQRLDIRSIGKIKQGELITGHKLQIEVVKNKVSPPFRKANTRLVYGYGVPKAWDILQMAEEHKVIEKKGAWYAFEGQNVGQGFDKTASILSGDLDLLFKLEQAVLEKAGYTPQ